VCHWWVLWVMPPGQQAHRCDTPPLHYSMLPGVLWSLDLVLPRGWVPLPLSLVVVSCALALGDGSYVLVCWWVGVVVVWCGDVVVGVHHDLPPCPSPLPVSPSPLLITSRG